MTNQPKRRNTGSLGTLLKEKLSERNSTGEAISIDGGNIPDRYETCPHCRTVHWIRCDDVRSLPVRRRPNGGFHLGFCFIAECSGCGGTLVYTSTAGTDYDDFRNESDLVWPASGALHQSIPERVRQIYLDAHRVQLVSPSSFAVQIRRALEAVCEDMGYGKSSGDLASRLRLLERDGHFPSLVVNVSHTLRVLGNLGAHATSKELSLGDTSRIDASFRAILDYLYVLPARLLDLRGIDEQPVPKDSCS